MVPNASDLARRRLTMVAIVRTLALIAWCVMAMPVVSIVSFLVYDPEPEIFVTLLIFLVGGAGIGAALWALAPWVSTRMMPTPRAHACPRCGYDLRSITDPRCPECGTPLTEEFLPDHVVRGPTASPEGRVLTAQLVAVIIGRVLGIFGCLGFGAGLIGVGIGFIAAPRWWGFEEFAGLAAWGGYCLVGFVASAFPVILPRRFARWLVPVRLLASQDRAAPSQHPSQHPSPPPAPPTTPNLDRGAAS